MNWEALENFEIVVFCFFPGKNYVAVRAYESSASYKLARPVGSVILTLYLQGIFLSQ